MIKLILRTDRTSHGLTFWREDNTPRPRNPRTQTMGTPRPEQTRHPQTTTRRRIPGTRGGTMSTATIEELDLAAMDWCPCCEVEYVSARGTIQESTCQCENAAEFVIEIRHCKPYRLFACRQCVAYKPSRGWMCRMCLGNFPEPLIIGKAS